LPKAGGISEYWGPNGEYTIKYCSTCAHCQVHTEFSNHKERLEKTDVCRGCMRLICLRCAGKPCLPWEKQCEYAERAYLKAKIERDGWGCY
jgi:hypothetical protein